MLDDVITKVVGGVADWCAVSEKGRTGSSLLRPSNRNGESGVHVFYSPAPRARLVLPNRQRGSALPQDASNIIFLLND